MVLASSFLFAQEEKAELIMGDKRYPITIQPSESGLFLTDKALEDRNGTIAVLKSEGFEVSTTKGRLIVGNMQAPLARAELVQRLRQLNSARSDLIKAAGIVIHYPGTDTYDVVTDQFVVKFTEAASSEEIRKLHEKSGVEVIFTSPYTPQLQVVRVVMEFEDALTLSNKYNDEGIVEYAQPNFLKQPAPRQAAFNDPLLSKQWHLINTGENGGVTDGGVADADIDADKAWAILRGDPSILIAILDGGFERDHPDLIDNLWVNPGETQHPGDATDGVDNDHNGYVDDVSGWDFWSCEFPDVGCGDNDPEWTSDSLWDNEHGTLSAGGAAARGDNGRGVSGSCPNCQFVPIRLGLFSIDYYLAIEYAGLIGADIISNSWGCDTGTCEPLVEDAINAVATQGRSGKGTPIFFAMNNEHVNHCIPPASEDYSSLENVIAVSEVSNQDKILTGIGTVTSPGGGFGDCMDILSPSWGGTRWATTTDLRNAPGYNSINTIPECPEAEGADLDYTFCATGTSFATPVAAGVGGLILSANSNLNREQVQRLLQDTADKVQPSTAGYSPVDGRSHPAGGAATHGYGRINAYEAVHVVAPLVAGGGANGGLGGVDVFLRDNDLDWGNTEQPSSTLFDSPRGFVPHWNSADIKVDAPPLSTPPTSSQSFELFNDEDPVSGAVNRVYVRVRNRGPNPANNVAVKLHWAFAGAGMPPLPNDFWTAFPNDSSDTSSWNPIAAQTITGLAYSGASVAGTATDPAKILQFDFAAPEFDSSLPNPTHYCLFVVVNSPQDPVSAQTIASTNVDDISPRDNNITQRNLMLVPLTNLNPFAFQMNVGNPFERAMEIKLHLEAPDGWAVEESEVPFDKAFEMEPKEKRLVKVTLKTAALPSGQTANIYQLAVDEVSHGEKILSGITIKSAPE
jgi:hypothetical protein